MWRLLQMALHLAWGCFVVAATFPFRTTASQRRAKRIWSAQLLRRLGIRLEHSGTLPEGGVLIVANHISWVDIFVINALRPCAFVCKDDVRAWPLIGWLVARNETVFIQRGSRSAARKTAETLCSTLREGAAMVVFPEGTTTNGTHMLPFRPAILQAAVDAAVPLTPIALRYRDRTHAISPAPAYDGDITLWQCMRAISLADGLTVTATVLPALDAVEARQHLAARAKHAIALALSMPHHAPPHDATEATGADQPGVATMVTPDQARNTAE